MSDIFDFDEYPSTQTRRAMYVRDIERDAGAQGKLFETCKHCAGHEPVLFLPGVRLTVMCGYCDGSGQVFTGRGE